MNEKENTNVFRFSLYQEEILLAEKLFEADVFNPFTRYSIDVRDILPKAITKLQKMLSKRNYDVIAEVGRKNIDNENSDEYIYDFFGYHQHMISLYPKEWRADMRYYPQSITQEIEVSFPFSKEAEKKIIHGVPCKVGLYINENPIVEREFFVDGFNPVCRQSLDVIDTVIEIADQIFNKIKKNDIQNMWDDYDLINYKGLSINQIRELSPYLRKEMLRKLRQH